MDKNRYILLVDDEIIITNALTRELREWTAKRSLGILTGQSAQEGLAQLEAHRGEVVIVISDLKMPGMLGSDFLLEVRRLYPDVVTILLTGFSEASEIVKIVRAGIFSFILKPWDATYLLAELTKAYDFREMRLENERYTKTIEDELRWAGELQRTILKPQLPRCEGLEFRVSYHPVSGLFCGGDYYDVIFVGNDRYLVLIGDVEGHGVKAAIVTGMLKATIYSEFVRGMIGKQFSPGAFLGWLNSRMNFEFRSASSMIITFFAGVMDVKASRFVYANAGHCHPFVVRGGAPTELPVSGSAIGFADEVAYPDQAVSTRPGDLFFMFTDGLVESGEANEFEPLALGPILQSTPYSAEFHRHVIESALAGSKSKGFADDVTIVSFKVI